MVNTLKIAKNGTLTLNGDLIAEKLTFSNIDQATSYGAIAISPTVLRLGQNITVTGPANVGNIQTGSCSTNDFCLTSSGPSSATWSQVNCSINENNACSAGTYWLVGG